MAKSASLHDAFVDELRDVYHAERQLVKALPKITRKTSAPRLRDALALHLAATKGHVDRLEAVFATIGRKVRAKPCKGMAGILDEAKSVVKEPFDAQTMDACLIAAVQRVEHYEMAAYATLIAWAQSLGHLEAVALLTSTLEEEKEADSTLASLAASGLSARAASAADVALVSVAVATGERVQGAKKRKKAGAAQLRRIARGS